MRWACRVLVAGSLMATIVSTLSVYPHSLAYFNEAAGGPENGEKHLLHSNLDWGQDLYYVIDLQRRHAFTGPMFLAWHGSFDPADLLFLDLVYYEAFRSRST